MKKRVFLALVHASATLTGFVPVEAAEAAAELRTATSFHRLRYKRPEQKEEEDLNRCLRTAVVPDIITYVNEDGEPSEETDVTVATYWDEESDCAMFFVHRGPVSYAKQSLRPPPMF